MRNHALTKFAVGMDFFGRKRGITRSLFDETGFREGVRLGNREGLTEGMRVGATVANVGETEKAGDLDG
jgi:hypothetical protein